MKPCHIPFLLFSLLISFASKAQLNRVSIQASGLTCSMCSNAINKALRSLEIVDKVNANIKTSTFDITFKPNSVISFDALRGKVEDAGFSIARLTATFHFAGETVRKDDHLNINGLVLHFLNVEPTTLTGEKTIQVVDKGYVSAKLYKKNQSLTSMPCYKTGTASHCCGKSATNPGTRIYHVTI
jgi:copper chaperone CopZ